MKTSITELQIGNDLVTIRPILPGDEGIEAAFVRNLSPESRRGRFLGGVRELSPKMLRQLCNVDGDRTMAFIATVESDGGEIGIGVSRFAPNTEEGVREMAIAVADEWQNRGIGTALVQRLIEYAKTNGVRVLFSSDLADNDKMRMLAEDLGMNVRRDPDDARQVIYSLSLSDTR